MSDVPLPDYERPPVIEVVTSVQFDPLPLPSVALGLFWQRVRARYPNTKDLGPIGARFERGADVGASGPSVSIEALSAPPLPRVFMEDESGNWVLQLQSDRLLHNWRKVAAEDEYPRHNAVYPQFVQAWKEWLAFLRDGELPTPRVNQLELTYVNHVLQGEGWSELSEMGNVFPSASWRPNGDFLPSPEVITWRSQFRLPDERGRLHVTLQQAIRRSDHRPVLLCELTARGLPADDDMDAWFALAREWIVRGFTDLTARSAHELWGRKA